MGCDIHVTAQRLVDGRHVDLDMEVFEWRDYGIFGFLADVRNYSDVPPLSSPRGYPEDCGHLVNDYHHSASWLSVEELRRFDYDATFEDRRTMRDGDGAADAGPGNGEVKTFREFLGKAYFEDLERMVVAGATRIVFDFDC